MKRRGLVFLLCLCLFVGFGTVCAGAYDVPAITNNYGAHNYVSTGYDNNWTDPSNSALVYDASAETYTRVEFNGEVVCVETYDSDFQFISGTTLEAELPIYGGFYSGKEYNFLIFGQENPEESNSVEVIRVVKYSKSWERLGAASLKGANTTVPFDAGGFSAEEYNGYLYIRTSHEMYTSEDGYNHQANLMMNVRIADMQVTDSYYECMNQAYGYVSHSFNQYVRIDSDGTIVALDHGDAYPRAVSLTRYNAKAGQDSFMESKRVSLGGGYYTYKYADYVHILDISGSVGANRTGVMVGGFEISDSAYLAVGNCIREDVTGNMLGQRQVYLTVTPKSSFTQEETSMIYLTDHTDGEEEYYVTNPHLVKISGDKFAILWTEVCYANNKETLYYVFVDGEGNLLTEVYAQESWALSDCVPIVADGKLVWYVTWDSAPAFFTIDLSDPTVVTHDCINSISYLYNRPPTVSYGATVICTCDICGAEEQFEIPALSEEDYVVEVIYQETCTRNGWAAYTYLLPNNNLFSITSTYLARHLESEFLGSFAASCEEGAYTAYHCDRCGEDFKTYSSEALGHEMGDWELPEDCVCGSYVESYRCCSRCDYEETKSVYYGHDYQQEIVPPTCTENGLAVLKCTRCGDVHHTDVYGNALGHDWTEWQVTGQPCQGTGGQIRRCKTCGETETEDLSMYEYECSYVNAGSDHCTDLCKWCGQERGHWYKSTYIGNLYECFYCGESALFENGEYVPHTHVFGKWTIDYLPTQTSDGQEIRKCTCGIAETREIPAQPQNPFTDVAYGTYYYEAVLWAAENKITAGVSAAIFAPDATCTRAQVVTFLWRAAGEPEPTISECAFTDVKEDDYYYKAMLWAVEKGITMGTSATTFTPNATCTRAQVVTFLWRSVGSPAPSSKRHSFTDVIATDYYYEAMLWAVENEVTSGYTETTFNPNGPCTRAQVVTFLYRSE